MEVGDDEDYHFVLGAYGPKKNVYNIPASTYEIEKLQSSGMLLQIDEDSLERNFTSFAALLESMDFAEVMADGILQIRLGGSD